MNQPSDYFYEFGPFHLHPAERMLTRKGEEVRLPPKVFDILLLMVQNRGHLLDKERMIEAIWPDTFVEEGNLTRYVSTLRRLLGEKRHERQYIVTAPKRGYRFIAPVREVRPEAQEDGAIPFEAAQSDRVIQSIAVLPFKPLVSDERDEALELGVADALITRLGGFSRMIVRPTSAVRKYTGLDQDAIAAGRELRVEAVLDGTIQRSDEQIRVTARLLSVACDVMLWAGQFDEAFTGAFSIQDSISERMVESLAVKLRREVKP